MNNLARLLVTVGFILSVVPAVGAPVDPAPVPPPQLTDPQLVQIALLANTSEIQDARVARARARSKAVLDFAAMMITDHGAARQQFVRLIRSINVIPLDSDVSRELKKTAAERLIGLRRLGATDFDLGYIAQELKVHQEVLDLFNRVLIPNAKNTDIRSLLEKTVPVIERHLKLADSIQRGFEE